MSSQIVLAKVPGRPAWSYVQHLQALSRAVHCRLDPSSSQHGAYVDEAGLLHYLHLDAAAHTTSELLAFQLQLRRGDGAPDAPISQPWAFEFVPGQPGEVLLVQAGSARVLYASLPRQGDAESDVFLFGTHTAPVMALACNGAAALSGCAAGRLKLWRLADGELADEAVEVADGTISAIECIGPLLVAAGSSAGSVTLYDIASGRLLAVQRLAAGAGPVSCLASWLSGEALGASCLAAPGPRVPDGGGLLPGPNIGLPWRDASAVAQTAGVQAADAPALLAVGSSAGWLRVFAASEHGSQSWRLLHSSDSLAAPITAAAFSPHGDMLAVAGRAAQAAGTDAVAVAAAGGQPGVVTWYHVSSSSSADGDDLVARLQQQQQALPLQLWRQWCMPSLPVGVFVLPGSSRLSLLQGKQLAASQGLDLLVMPALGPCLILTAVQQLEPQQQQGLSDAGAAQDPLLLQDWAQRGWQDAADAISGASELQGGQLDAMLAELVADSCWGAAVVAAGDAGGSLEAAAGADSAGERQRNPPEQLQEGGVEQQQQQQHGSGGERRVGARRPLFGAGAGEARFAADAAALFGNSAGAASVASPAAVSAAAAAEQAVPAIVKPTTLPGLRSWMDRAAALAAGTVAPVPAAPVDLQALAQEMQRHQQQTQQQEGAASPPPAGEAAASGAEDVPSADPAAVAAAAAAAAGAEEDELPCESSFQQLLEEPGPASDGAAAAAAAAAAGPESGGRAADAVDDGSAPASPAQPAATAGSPAGATPAAAAAEVVASAVPAAAAAAVGLVGGQGEEEDEPQPRQLPAALRLPGAAPLRTSGGGSSSARGLPTPVQQQGRPALAAAGAGVAARLRPAAAVAPAAVCRTSVDAVASTDGSPERAAPPALVPRAVLPPQQQPAPGMPQPQRQQQRAPAGMQQRPRPALALRQRRAGEQQQQGSADGVPPAGPAVAAAGPPPLPASDHQLAVAVANSSLLLARKIQEAEQAPDVTVDPSDPSVVRLAAKLAMLDVPLDAQLFTGLPDLKDVPTPTRAPKLVPKQLDARWLAQRRQLQPQLSTLFKPHEWQAGAVAPQLLVTPAWPTPQQVAEGLLWW